MGKIFAALISACVLAWLGPMCARLPEEPARVAGSTAAPAAEAPAPLAAHPPVAIATYRMKKMFEARGSRYLIYVIRANPADVPAVDMRMILATKIKGALVEQDAGAAAQTLAPGTTAYAGLSVSTVLIDEMLAGPEEPGTELEWSLSYRFEGDDPGARRCFQLRALPRRREPTGILWRALGESRECGPGGR
ncbi:MAG: hypothetical protein HY403_11980 [Elusimicrobia bacterium]|nr:hypothetical protein [Elusimicrobiota bacterium]